MSDFKNIDKALGDNAKFYPEYMKNKVASDFKFHLDNGIGRMVDKIAELERLLGLDRKDRERESLLIKKLKNQNEQQDLGGTLDFHNESTSLKISKELLEKLKKGEE